MPIYLLFVSMQMTCAATLRCRPLEVERFEILIDFGYVVLVTRSSADDVAGLDVEGLSFGHDFGFALVLNTPLQMILSLQRKIMRRYSITCLTLL